MDVLKQRRTFVMDRLATTIKLLFLALTCPPRLCKFSLTQGFLWVPKDLSQELESVCWYNHMWVLPYSFSCSPSFSLVSSILNTLWRYLTHTIAGRICHTSSGSMLRAHSQGSKSADLRTVLSRSGWNHSFLQGLKVVSRLLQEPSALLSLLGLHPSQLAGCLRDSSPNAIIIL